ncbi:MAG: hypothetical protein Q9162_000872 [Coniocarpon cinnabarinum]
MKSSRLSRENFTASVDPKRGDLLLLACCFVTGLLDCGVFNNYGVFVGMQTGNTVILCLSTASLPQAQPYAYATTLVSLLSFMAGALTTSLLSNFFGPLRRHVLPLNFTFQCICIILAASITSAHLIPTDSHGTNPDILRDPKIIAALPALAFQSGATIVTSRILGYGTMIPVNVLTSTYAALATDSALLNLENAQRNRRVGACVCVVSGALIAAWIQKRGPGIELVLWLAAGIKGVLGIAVLLGMETQHVRESRDEKAENT